MSPSSPNPPPASLARLTSQWLGHRVTLTLAALLPIALAWPTVSDGFTLDDRVHRAIVQRSSPLLHGGTFDLFRTATGEPSQVAPLVNAGAFPWFTQPDFRVAFWRPIASAWHTVDYSLWPNAAWLMHLENLLLYATLVVLVGHLFRSIHARPWVAGVATLLFAVDASHASAVGWIACRNSILASGFAIGALIAYRASVLPINERSASPRVASWLGPILFCAALLSGEIALGLVGFLVAHALILDQRSARQRVESLLPFALVVIGWAVAYRALSYGVRGSGYYVDPIADPLAFALGLAKNGPTLVAFALGLPTLYLPSTLVMSLASQPSARLLAWAGVTMLFVIVTAPWLWRDRIARFYALSFLLSLLPMCATLPQRRLLLLASVGAMGLVAQLLAVLIHPTQDMDRSRWSWRLWRFPAWGLCALLLATHGIFAPLAFSAEASDKGRQAASLDAAIRDVHSRVDWMGRPLILVNAPHAFVATAFLFHDQASKPSLVRALHVGPGPLTVTRADPNVVSIHDPSGMLREPTSWLFHGLQHPIHTGQRVRLEHVTFEVVSTTPEGRPVTVLCRFERDIDHDDAVWLMWRAGRYEPFVPPAVGQSMRLD